MPEPVKSSQLPIPGIQGLSRDYKALIDELFPAQGPPTNMTELGRQQFSGDPLGAGLAALTAGPMAWSKHARDVMNAANQLPVPLGMSILSKGRGLTKAAEEMLQLTRGGPIKGQLLEDAFSAVYPELENMAGATARTHGFNLGDTGPIEDFTTEAAMAITEMLDKGLPEGVDAAAALKRIAQHAIERKAVQLKPELEALYSGQSLDAPLTTEEGATIASPEPLSDSARSQIARGETEAFINPEPVSSGQIAAAGENPLTAAGLTKGRDVRTLIRDTFERGRSRTEAMQKLGAGLSKEGKLTGNIQVGPNKRAVDLKKRIIDILGPQVEGQLTETLGHAPAQKELVAAVLDEYAPYRQLQKTSKAPGDIEAAIKTVLSRESINSPIRKTFSSSLVELPGGGRPLYEPAKMYLIDGMSPGEIARRVGRANSPSQLQIYSNQLTQLRNKVFAELGVTPESLIPKPVARAAKTVKEVAPSQHGEVKIIMQGGKPVEAPLLPE